MYLICTLSGMQMFYFLNVTMFRMPHMTSCTPVASLIFLAFQKVEERKNSTYIFYFVKKKKKNHLLISNLGASLLVGGPGNNLSPYCEIEAINS